AELDRFALRGGRQIDNRRNEATGVAAPRLAASQWVAVRAADRVIVTAASEAAAGGQNVAKCAARDRNFQNAPIVTGRSTSGFQIVIVPEAQLYGLRGERDND